MSILVASLSCHLSKGYMSKPDTLHLSCCHHLRAFVIVSCVKLYSIFSQRNMSEMKCGIVNEQNN